MKSEDTLPHGNIYKQEYHLLKNLCNWNFSTLYESNSFTTRISLIYVKNITTMCETRRKNIYFTTGFLKWL